FRRDPAGWGGGLVSGRLGIRRQAEPLQRQVPWPFDFRLLPERQRKIEPLVRHTPRQAIEKPRTDKHPALQRSDDGQSSATASGCRCRVYRYDQLVVLRTTRMPAVLLEAGSIISRDEELLLNSADHQALIGAAVTEGVETFGAHRLQPAAIGTPGKRLRCHQDYAWACSTASE